MNAYLLNVEGDHIVVVADSPDAAIQIARTRHLLDLDLEIKEPATVEACKEWNSEHFTSCALVGPVLEPHEDDS